MDRLLSKVSGLALASALWLSSFGQAAEADGFRQVYDLDPKRVESNAAKVAGDLQGLSAAWRDSPVVYYAVPAMSPVMRLPDAYPDDGKVCGPAELVMAKNEYEPASVVVYPRANVDKFALRASALESGDNTIPASEIDIKMVKVWYQGGSAWWGYFADPGRMLVPEILLNDENLIRVDTKTRDNYVRYSNADGSTTYAWMSFELGPVNYTSTGMANIDLIQDAETPQPVVLNKHELKQFLVTFHVPKDAPEGVYSGRLDLVADGETVGAVPVRLRVLPFELPRARTNYDLNKEFYLCLYGTGTDRPKIMRNLARHNNLRLWRYPLLSTLDPERFERQIKLAEECGLLTRPLFGSSPYVNLLIYNSEHPTAKQRISLAILKRVIADIARICQQLLGHADFYSYGYDEGSPSVIRAERDAWRVAHESGAKVMVTSYPWRKLLFALDMLIIPGMPNEKKKKEVDLFHESNPNAKVSWYGDPHTPPENPDYFRRIQGMMAYKSNYDVSSNHTWWRNDWNDFAVAPEPFYRGFCKVYAQKDDVLDTLAWEGIREGLDDVRYATKLKLLANEAMRSKDADARLLGRRALSYLTYADGTRADLDALRMECINYILQLRNALGRKGQQ